MSDTKFHFYLKRPGWALTDEVGVFFGNKICINCPTCNSEKISIFFKPGFKGINMGQWEEIIEKNNFELCNVYEEIMKCNFNPNWICKDCHDCGVIKNE
jgi:hypothetical protein